TPRSTPRSRTAITPASRAGRSGGRDPSSAHLTCSPGGATSTRRQRARSGCTTPARSVLPQPPFSPSHGTLPGMSFISTGGGLLIPSGSMPSARPGVESGSDSLGIYDASSMAGFGGSGVGLGGVGGGYGPAG